MATAERLMEEHPDSALTLLQTIPTNTISGERRRALHALLLSQALDKNYIDITSDSLISPVIDYFDKTCERPYQSLAHFYAARVALNARDHTAALIHLTDAEATADTSAHLLLGLIYRNLMEIYASNSNLINQEFYAKKSLQHFLQNNQAKYYEYARIEHARALVGLTGYDEAEALLHTAMQSNEITENPSLISEAYKIYACIFMAKNELPQAIECYNNVMAIAPGDMTPDDYMNLLNCLAANGNISESQRLFDSIKSAYPDKTSFNIHLARHDYHAAFSNLWKMYTQLDSIHKFDNDRHLEMAMLNHQKQQAKQLQNELHLKQLTWIAISILLLISLTCIIFFAKRRITRHKIKNEQAIQAIVLLNHEIDRFKSISQNLNLKISELSWSRFCAINKLCSITKIASTPDQSNPISNKLDEIIARFNDTFPINELELAVNLKRNNIVADFRRDFPLLPSKDLTLFIYSAIGFSPRTISLVSGNKTENIYLWRTRLRKKIQQSNSTRAEEYLNILSLGAIE